MSLESPPLAAGNVESLGRVAPATLTEVQPEKGPRKQHHANRKRGG